jgi:branched-subunit amino acid transport protein
MSTWWIMIFGGLLTYVTRLSFILLFGYVDIPAWLRKALKYVPPSVLTALIFPELLLHSGSLDISAGNLRLLAGGTAIAVAWRTRNVWFTILSGMIALIVLQALL